MAQTMKQETYRHFAHLSSKGNPPAFPDGSLLRSEDAGKPLWRIISRQGIDCFFNTLREAQEFCENRDYRFVGPGMKGRRPA